MAASTGPITEVAKMRPLKKLLGVASARPVIDRRKACHLDPP